MSALPHGPEPFRIEPLFLPRIWGARSLAPLFPEKSNLSEPIGEAWLTGVDCRIASGAFAGKKLGSAWKEMPANWRGERLASVSEFPILLKFIFPKDKLSIQVHPDDAYAALHEKSAGGRGKTEMWHVIAAEPGAKVLVGLKPGSTAETFRAGIAAQDLDELFAAHEVSAGDTFFIRARTPHTIGPGMVLCEVQQYSDLTYRVYDYGRVDSSGRPRELHIDKALAVMNFNSVGDAKVKSLLLPSPGAFKSLLAACPFFATERWEFEWRFETACDASHFDLLTILEGSGALEWTGGAGVYRRGECWFVPACAGKLALNASSSTALLRTYVPDVQTLRADLKGIAQNSLARVIFD